MCVLCLYTHSVPNGAVTWQMTRQKKRDRRCNPVISLAHVPKASPSLSPAAADMDVVSQQQVIQPSLPFAAPSLVAPSLAAPFTFPSMFAPTPLMAPVAAAAPQYGFGLCSCGRHATAAPTPYFPYHPFAAAQPLMMQAPLLNSLMQPQAAACGGFGGMCHHQHAQMAMQFPAAVLPHHQHIAQPFGMVAMV